MTIVGKAAKNEQFIDELAHCRVLLQPLAIRIQGSFTVSIAFPFAIDAVDHDPPGREPGDCLRDHKLAAFASSGAIIR